MKLLFSLLLIYMAYRFFFVRPQLKSPYRQEGNISRPNSSSQTNVRSKDDEDYIDYEEVD